MSDALGSPEHDALRELPEHRALFRALDAWTHGLDGRLGLVLSGSLVHGTMDRWSDLDLGLVLADEATRRELWERRWAWDLPAWFHRFDADHVKPWFVIHWFEPGIQVDLALYTPEDLPSAAGGPYRLHGVCDARLERWLSELEHDGEAPVDWSNAWHEEERFWAWTAYCARHVARGEHYHVAAELFALRDLLEQWLARLELGTAFPVRHTEARLDGPELRRLARCFPAADGAALRSALLTLIELEGELRPRVERAAGVSWRTSAEARARITEMVRGLGSG